MGDTSLIRVRDNRNFVIARKNQATPPLYFNPQRQHMAASRPDLWTPEQDTKLERLGRAGYSATEIAIKLQRTRNAVIGRARRLFGSLSTLAPRDNPREAVSTPEKSLHARNAVRPPVVPVSATLAVTGCRWIEDGAYCNLPVEPGARFLFCPTCMRKAFK